MLERAIPTMLAQRLEGGEIEFIFAEGNSTDHSREVLERFAAADPRVRVIDNPTGRTPDGLNIALAHSRGEFVARMMPTASTRITTLPRGSPGCGAATSRGWQVHPFRAPTATSPARPRSRCACRWGEGLRSAGPVRES